nr:uncharacterized protein LOC109184338 [Ipomoea trifida]
MAARSRKGIFLGIPAHTKGYLIYDVHDRSVFVSRDVTFYEKQFLFDKDGLLTDEIPTAEPCLPIIPTSHYKEFQPSDDTQMNGITVPPDLLEAPGVDLSANIDQLHSFVPTTVEIPHNEPSSTHADNREPETQISPPVLPRRSNRQRQPPSKLIDYYCDTVIQNRTSPHAISKVISYDGLTPAHKQFAMAQVPDGNNEHQSPFHSFPRLPPLPHSQISGNIKPPTVVSSNGGDGLLALFSGDEQQSLHVPVGMSGFGLSRRRQSRGQWLRRFLPSCSSSACHSRVQSDGLHTSVPGGRRESGDHRRYSRRNEVAGVVAALPSPLGQERKQATAVAAPKWRGLIPLSKSPAFGVKKERQTFDVERWWRQRRKLATVLFVHSSSRSQEQVPDGNNEHQSPFHSFPRLPPLPHSQIGGNIKPPTVVSSNGGDGLLALFSGDEQQSLHVPVGMQQAIGNNSAERRASHIGSRRQERKRRSSSLLPAERGSGHRGGSPLSARPRTEAGDGGSSSVSPCRIHVSTSHVRRQATECGAILGSSLKQVAGPHSPLEVSCVRRQEGTANVRRGTMVAATEEVGDGSLCSQ